MVYFVHRAKAIVGTFTTCWALLCLGFTGCAADESAAQFSNTHDLLESPWDAGSVVEDLSSDDATGTENLGEDTEAFQASDAQDSADMGPVEQDADLAPEALNMLKLESPSAFRVSNLWISAPPLCASLNEGDDCVNMEAMANTALTASLIDTVDPLDLVGVLTASGDADASHLNFGESECTRSGGTIVSCEVNETPTDFGPVLLSEEQNCWPSKEDYKSDSAWMAEAPCFFTQEKTASLNILGFEVTMQEMQILGHLKYNDGEVAVPTGQIIAFLPEDVAALVTMELENQSMVDEISLADLLHSKAMVMHSSGQMGWNVVISFDAEKVPLQSP